MPNSTRLRATLACAFSFVALAGTLATAGQRSTPTPTRQQQQQQQPATKAPATAPDAPREDEDYDPPSQEELDEAQRTRDAEQIRAVLEKLAALGGKPIETLTPAEARKQPTVANAVDAVLAARKLRATPEPIGSVEDRTIDGAAGKIAARIYTPRGTGPYPVVVYFHGGGWVIGTIDAYDASARALANAANAIVVSVEYRKGPEAKFPAAHEDAFAAYKWTVANAASFKGDPKRVAVAGESAGGNLAANVSIMARDRKFQMPVYQILVYPVASDDLDAPSAVEHANAKPLNRAMLRWFLGHYLKTPAEASDPRIALVRADLKGLPPTTVITAEIDPLRSGGLALAERLRAAGVRVDARDYDGVTHEFFGTGAVVDKARQAVEQAASGMNAALER